MSGAFPLFAQDVPKPELFPTQTCSAAAVAYRSPSPPAPVRQQPWAQRTPATTTATASASSSTPEKDIFLRNRNSTRTRGCAFCCMPGHRIRGCPAAEEYVETGRVKIVNNRLHLPTGQPIPNYYGRRGLGLQASVDAWLAALTNSLSGDSTAQTLQPGAPDSSTPIYSGLETIQDRSSWSRPVRVSQERKHLGGDKRH